VFSRITGSIVERGDDLVLLDVGGLAYEIVLPPCVAEKVPATLGERVTLEVHPTFNLDGNSGRFTFFGFTNAVEREFFEALISLRASGREDRRARVLASDGRIAQAIDAADHAFLVKLPGIGQQKARDIVAKLQGKVTKLLLIQDADPRASEPIPDFAEEALSVLLQLEYKRGEAEAMIAETLARRARIARCGDAACRNLPAKNRARRPCERRSARERGAR
jgi:Holliday junction DNA helicase RuvA